MAIKVANERHSQLTTTTVNAGVAPTTGVSTAVQHIAAEASTSAAKGVASGDTADQAGAQEAATAVDGAHVGPVVSPHPAAEPGKRKKRSKSGIAC